jgi:hypothetical protein
VQDVQLVVEHRVESRHHPGEVLHQVADFRVGREGHHAVVSVGEAMEGRLEQQVEAVLVIRHRRAHLQGEGVGFSVKRRNGRVLLSELCESVTSGAVLEVLTSRGPLVCLAVPDLGLVGVVQVVFVLLVQHHGAEVALDAGLALGEEHVLALLVVVQEVEDQGRGQVDEGEVVVRKVLLFFLFEGRLFSGLLVEGDARQTLGTAAGGHSRCV